VNVSVGTGRYSFGQRFPLFPVWFWLVAFDGCQQTALPAACKAQKPRNVIALWVIMKEKSKFEKWMDEMAEHAIALICWAAVIIAIIGFLIFLWGPIK
jgi:hypothetical protein